MDLSNARGCGFAPEPISYGDLEAYCRIHGIEKVEHFVFCVKEMDALWLEKAAERSK